jgi:hypothetical protein
MKAASLLSLAKALEAAPAEAPEMSALRRDLFVRAGELNNAPSTMAFCTTLLRAPIAPIRNGVYAVLTAAGRHAWGLRAMFGTAGFREFLMDRRTELTKEGKEWKYSLVRNPRLQAS